MPPVIPASLLTRETLTHLCSFYCHSLTEQFLADKPDALVLQDFVREHGLDLYPVNQDTKLKIGPFGAGYEPSISDRWIVYDLLRMIHAGLPEVQGGYPRQIFSNLERWMRGYTSLHILNTNRDPDTAAMVIAHYCLVIQDRAGGFYHEQFYTTPPRLGQTPQILVPDAIALISQQVTSPYGENAYNRCYLLHMLDPYLPPVPDHTFFI